MPQPWCTFTKAVLFSLRPPAALLGLLLLPPLPGCISELTGTGEGPFDGRDEPEDSGVPQDASSSPDAEGDAGLRDAAIDGGRDRDGSLLDAAVADATPVMDAAPVMDAETHADAEADDATTGPPEDAALADAGARDAQLPDATDLDAAPDAAGGDAGDQRDAAPRDDAGLPIRSSGPGDWTAGDYPPDLSAQTYLRIAVPGQGARRYKVHVPPSYEPHTPMPLVFAFHGYDQDPVEFAITGAALHTKADAAGFILVLPLGTPTPILGGNESFNGGTCCGVAALNDVDDVAFTRAVFEDVIGHLNVNLDRVFAAGLSNGGYMAYRLGCEASDIFAAVVSVGGAIGTADLDPGSGSDLARCEPDHPVALLAIHGTDDAKVTYARFQPAFNHWAEHHDCGGSRRQPEIAPSGGDTTCTTQLDCDDAVEITGCTVDGGGRCWFGSENCGNSDPSPGGNSDWLVTNEAMWSFFERTMRRFEP